MLIPPDAKLWLIELMMAYPIFLMDRYGVSDEEAIEKTKADLQLLTFLPPPPIRGVHIGCGRGELVAFMAERHGDLGTFVGIDIPDRIAEARELAEKAGIEIAFQGTALPRLSLPSDGFNMVVVSGPSSRVTLDYWETLLQESARVTMEEGIYALNYRCRPEVPAICPMEAFRTLVEVGVGTSVTIEWQDEARQFILLLGKKRLEWAQVWTQVMGQGPPIVH